MHAKSGCALLIKMVEYIKIIYYLILITSYKLYEYQYCFINTCCIIILPLKESKYSTDSAHQSSSRKSVQLMHRLCTHKNNYSKHHENEQMYNSSKYFCKHHPNFPFSSRVQNIPHKRICVAAAICTYKSNNKETTQKYHFIHNTFILRPTK